MLECRYRGWCRIEYDTIFDVCYPCVGDCGETCAEYEPMPDVKALKGLADEMDGLGISSFSSGWYVGCFARRIREACGEAGAKPGGRS